MFKSKIEAISESIILSDTLVWRSPFSTNSNSDEQVEEDYSSQRKNVNAVSSSVV